MRSKQSFQYDGPERIIVILRYFWLRRLKQDVDAFAATITSVVNVFRKSNTSIIATIWSTDYFNCRLFRVSKYKWVIGNRQSEIERFLLSCRSFLRFFIPTSFVCFCQFTQIDASCYKNQLQDSVSVSFDSRSIGIVY